MRIVLDTNIARNGGYDDRVADEFLRMRTAGLSFHLADTAIVEILAQLGTGRLTWNRWLRARQNLHRFLDRAAPILPGGQQLLALAGITREGDPSVDLDRERHHYCRGWRRVLRAPTLDDLRCPTWIMLDGQPVEFGCDLEEADRMLARVKRGWVDLFERLVAAGLRRADQNTLRLAEHVGRTLDRKVTGFPPPSVRLDAMLRVHERYVLLHGRHRNPYNPQKRANDAIDYDLLRYLALPTVVCTEDRGLLAAVREAGTWQAGWVMSSDELIERFHNGSLPSMEWPARTGEHGRRTEKHHPHAER